MTPLAKRIADPIVPNSGVLPKPAVELKILHPEDHPAPTATQPATPPVASEEFLAELAEHSAQLETASPQEIITWAAETYAPRLGMATAFGPEGCVILHMLATLAPETYVFNLDTGYQFKETLELRDRIAARYGIEVELRKPELSVAEYEAAHGGPVYETDSNQCCFDRNIRLSYNRSQAP